MKDKKKLLFNIFIFILLIFLTYYIIFRNYDMKYVYQNIMNLDIFYLIVAFLMMFLYFVLEALNIRFILKTFNEKLPLLKAIKNIFICFFFSAVTPGGSGGQPVAIYFLSKEKVNVSHSTMAFLIELFGYNCSKVVIGLISFILLPHELRSDLKIFYIIGFAFGMVPISLTLIGIFYKKVAAKLVDIFIKILKFFNIKNIKEKETTIRDELKLFNESSSYVKKHRKEFFKSLLLSFCQVLVYYMIPFFVYKSLHLSGVTIITFVMLQAILHNSSSSIPLPGAVGITETVFLLVYGYIYTSADLLQSSLIVNRMVTFYIYVIISLIVYLFAIIKSGNKKTLDN